MKKMMKRLVSIGLVVVLFFGFQRLVMPKYTSDVLEGGFTEEYYREKLPHQVLMVGDCEVYGNFSPVTLWREHGITSYIRGSAQQLAWQSYYLLEEALKQETPDVVVFNVTELIHNEPAREEYNRMTLDGMKWSKSKVEAIRASMTEEESMLDYVFPLLRYHSRILELEKDDFKYLFGSDMDRTIAGYYMRVDTAPYEEGIWDEEAPEDFELGSYAMSYLDKIREICEEKGVRLLLVKAPSLSPIWWDEWEQQIEDYAKTYSLDYINFLELVDELGIDFTTDTYDEGLHMNLAGAEKVTGYLGKFLAEEYQLEDMRKDAEVSAVWAEEEKLHEKIKNQQLEELETYGEVISY